MRGVTSPSPYCIVFDIGGTSMRAAIMTPRGRLLGTPQRYPTPNMWNQRAPIRVVQQRLIDGIVAIVRQCRAKHPRYRLRHVGISMAGSVTVDGVMRHASGLWGAQGQHFPLRARLQRHLQLQWHVINDMTAAAAYYGSLPRYRRFRWIAVVTVSSGVGSKVYDTIQDEVLMDPAGLSGELGHVRMDFSPTAMRCECGGRGHIQGLCSGRAAERLARHLALRERRRFRASCLWRLTQHGRRPITAYDLEAGVKRHDPFAREVLRQLTEPLARAIAMLVGTIGVERVIIVGGFALALGRHYQRMLQSQLLKVGCAGRTATQTKQLICLGQRGDRHGLIGAGLLAQKHS